MQTGLTYSIISVDLTKCMTIDSKMQYLLLLTVSALYNRIFKLKFVEKALVCATTH